MTGGTWTTAGFRESGLSDSSPLRRTRWPASRAARGASAASPARRSPHSSPRVPARRVAPRPDSPQRARPAGCPCRPASVRGRGGSQVDPCGTGEAHPACGRTRARPAPQSFRAPEVGMTVARSTGAPSSPASRESGGRRAPSAPQRGPLEQASTAGSSSGRSRRARRPARPDARPPAAPAWAGPAPQGPPPRADLRRPSRIA